MQIVLRNYMEFMNNLWIRYERNDLKMIAKNLKDFIKIV